MIYLLKFYKKKTGKSTFINSLDSINSMNCRRRCETPLIKKNLTRLGCGLGKMNGCVISNVPPESLRHSTIDPVRNSEKCLIPFTMIH